ncbi:helix-turn-helix domain-containing protein [Brucella intermedia]|uniref:helix-turn-helix domain-containing protein n=1 Tax=Brucella intermedia TaxID=94625 RepID=UPI00165CF75B|nr:helix-turn-helix transcriptional regulator [Brucella intermedia]QNQ40040.1 helix-turn-helix transcriptional regulator [Brucella intermedia]
MISPAQCRAARALLAWSQSDLCEAANVGRATLANFESEKSTPYERTLRDIQSALEKAGIEFLGETGVGMVVKD